MGVDGNGNHLGVQRLGRNRSSDYEEVGMKCEENGGCPLLFDSWVSQWCPGADNLAGVDACHLTPDQFSLIRAMLAGEWKCETCKRMVGNGGLLCPRYSEEDSYTTSPCSDWIPKGEGSDE